MSLPLSSLDSQTAPALDSAPSAAPALGAAPDSARDSARSHRPCASGAKPAPKSPGRKPKAPASASDAPADRPTPKLALDLKAVADADGLKQEVAVLRASIRQLANDGDMAMHVKVLAELRHQIEALCRALKTQQSLEGHDSDERAAEMDRVLEELGNALGVER